MVERDLVARGIRDPRVLQAMGSVPREEFVAADLRRLAYEDAALPIEEGQTISQPYIVALMAEALELRGDETVLDVGTGSGYAAAVLSRIVPRVYTIERHRRLVELARRRFVELGYDNIESRHGDGSLGWPERAPFDAIVVAAGGPEIPAPLLEQLRAGGRMILPVGPRRHAQRLVRVRRAATGPGYEAEELEPVRFVPLLGAAGWRESGTGSGWLSRWRGRRGRG